MGVKAVMDMAVGFLGIKESPAGSNNCVFNTHYYGKEVSGSGYAWCVVFLWDVFRLANASECFFRGKKTAYVPALQTWAKQDGLQVPAESARYGDIVIFDWDHDGRGDHVGLLEERDRDGNFVCIEGNTSLGNDSNGGAVMRRLRTEDQILMVIRPPYPEEPAASPEQIRELIRSELEKRVYPTLADIPAWGRPAVQRMLDTGALQGEGSGKLNISHDLLRCLVILDRMKNK